jgi:protein TonB
MEIRLVLIAFICLYITGCALGLRSSSDIVRWSPAFAEKNILLLVAASPRYPKKLFGQNVAGHVIVDFTIQKDGAVDRNSIRVINSMPEKVFDAAAVRAASLLKYKPVKINGEIKTVTGVKVRYAFTLKK